MPMPTAHLMSPPTYSMCLTVAVAPYASMSTCHISTIPRACAQAAVIVQLPHQHPCNLAWLCCVCRWSSRSRLVLTAHCARCSCCAHPLGPHTASLTTTITRGLTTACQKAAAAYARYAGRWTPCVLPGALWLCTAAR
jgi:hypothetical protein